MKKVIKYSVAIVDVYDDFKEQLKLTSKGEIIIVPFEKNDREYFENQMYEAFSHAAWLFEEGKVTYGKWSDFKEWFDKNYSIKSSPIAQSINNGKVGKFFHSLNDNKHIKD